MSHVFLREIRRTDLPLINGWRGDRSLIEQLGSPFRHVGPEVDERWFEQYLATRTNNVRLAICTSNEQMIGAVYLLGIDWVNRNTEFAIWIGDPAARNRGIGEAATRQALDHAFLDLNLERIYLHVLTNNTRAIKLYRKVGFVQEGIQRRAVYKGGEYRDLLLMSLLRHEYRAGRPLGR